LEITKEEKEKHTDLLYHTRKSKSHYCWIRNLEKLVRSQLTKHTEKILLCKMCLRSFYSKDKLKDHKTYCGKNKCAKIVMSKHDENILEFKHYKHSIKVLFVV